MDNIVVENLKADIDMRPATANDAATIAELLTDAMYYKNKRGDNAWDTNPFSIEEVTPFLPNTYILYVGNLPVGTVLLEWEDKIWGDRAVDAGYVHRLAVKSGFHGRKLGEAIMKWAMAQVKENKRKYIRLDCPKANLKLCQYYEDLGFKQVRLVSHHGHDFALYEQKA